jgi:hypothetical protein
MSLLQSLVMIRKACYCPWLHSKEAGSLLILLPVLLVPIVPQKSNFNHCSLILNPEPGTLTHPAQDFGSMRHSDFLFWSTKICILFLSLVLSFYFLSLYYFHHCSDSVIEEIYWYMNTLFWLGCIIKSSHLVLFCTYYPLIIHSN